MNGMYAAFMRIIEVLSKQKLNMKSRIDDLMEASISERLLSKNGQSMAVNPDDVGMLDCVGLDASLPRVIKEFAAGEI